MRKEKRKKEILDAASTLYETMHYRDINIKEISTITSINRTSIYNYFETKEEIFLSLLEEEYRAWANELTNTAKQKILHSANDLAKYIANSLANRPVMLKLISNNLTDFEENSRDEKIISFKEAYGATLQAMNLLLEQVFSNWSKQERTNFIYSFFPFLFWVYPYTTVTKRQKMGMEAANLSFIQFSIYDLVYNFLRQLLSKEFD